MSRSTTADVNLNAIRAKHQGEALAHCITRTAFLRHVIADDRTRCLFECWGEQTGVDAVVDQMIALLDAAAQRAGLAHRSELRGPARHHLAPILGFLQQHEAHYERLLAETQAARAHQAIGFVVASLFGTLVDEEVPVRVWLASDLLTIFESAVAARVYGEPARLGVPLSPTVKPVPEGQRPMHQGEHLARNADWYYRAVVADPKVTRAALAREHADAAGVKREPKDTAAGILERPDTKAVRAGIREAKRLLELPVPPELWDQYIRNQA